MLLPDDSPRLAALLTDLATTTGADYVLLVNPDGALCRAAGNDTHGAGQRLRETLRGDLFAHIGADPARPIRRPGMAFQQGDTYHVMIAEVLPDHVLALVVDRAADIGRLKRFTLQARGQISDLLGAA